MWFQQDSLQYYLLWFISSGLGDCEPIFRNGLTGGKGDWNSSCRGGGNGPGSDGGGGGGGGGAGGGDGTKYQSDIFVCKG